MDKKHDIPYIITCALLIFLLSPRHACGQDFYINGISISGNKHTKEVVIRRELPFKAGRIYGKQSLDEQIESAKGNLMNTSLFNYVDITYSKAAGAPAPDHETAVDYDEAIDISIRVEERWYIWPLLGINFEDRNLSSWFKEMDFTKISGDAGIIVDNLWGLNHSLNIGGSFGYKKAAYIKYNKISLDRNGKHSINLSASYTLNSTENIIALNNKPVYLKINDGYIKKRFAASIKYTNRPILRLKNDFTVEYANVSIADTILKINPEYWGSGKTHRETVTATYELKYDRRDYAQYPTEGYYAEASLSGIFDLNTSFRMGKLSARFELYNKLSDRWFIANTMSAGFSLKNNQAYIYDKAIGYGDANIRGFEYVTIDGQQYVTSNNTVRFCLMPTKIFTIDFLSFIPKFNKIHFTIYANAFFDMGYAYNVNMPDVPLDDKFLYSAGIGIDVVTYYDIVIGAHCAVTNEGNAGIFFTLRTAFF